MRFAFSFGISKDDWVKDFILLGARWYRFDSELQWVELHLLGFRFFFAFNGY